MGAAIRQHLSTESIYRMPAVAYHCSAKTISRSKGQSVLASIAYRTGERLHDARIEKTFDYRAKDGVLFVYHAAPKDAPAWTQELNSAWNAVEQVENRKNSTLAREYELTFPHQLTEQQREWLLKDFIREEFTRKGFLATGAIHAPGKEGDDKNYHAHVVFSERPLTADGFADHKDRRFSDYNSREDTLQALKEDWAERCADQLARAGFDIEAARWRHGHLTLNEQKQKALDRGDHEYAQECDREPGRHLGPAATALERQGIPTDIGDHNREIDARATERAAIQQELAELEQQLAVLDRAERLSKIPEVQEIGRAWDRSDSGSAFVQALEEHNILIACVSREDAAESTRRHDALQSQGNAAPEFHEQQFVAVTKQGQVYLLDPATLNAPQEQIDARLQQLDPNNHVTLAQAQEIMATWREVERHEHTERLSWQDVKYLAMDTAHHTVNLVGAASLLGGYAVRMGESAFRTLGGVLDYFFGGVVGDGEARRIVRDDDKTFLERTPRAELLNHPRVTEILNADTSKIPLPILEELRRQQEQRERERGDRDR